MAALQTHPVFYYRVSLPESPVLKDIILKCTIIDDNTVKVDDESIDMIYKAFKKNVSNPLSKLQLPKNSDVSYFEKTIGFPKGYIDKYINGRESQDGLKQIYDKLIVTESHAISDRTLNDIIDNLEGRPLEYTNYKEGGRRKSRKVRKSRSRRYRRSRR